MARRHLSLRHFRRLLQLLRQEGPRQTGRRVRLWWQATGGGARPSILPEQTGAPAATDLQSFWTDLAERHAFRIPSPPLQNRRRKVALIGDLNLPQCRKYRVEQLSELMRLSGADYTFSHYEDVPRCMDILQDASHVMLYRLSTHPLVTQYLYEARRLRLPVLYDIDDPLFSVPAYAGYANMAALPPGMRDHFLAQAPRYAEVMNVADAISVSTPALQAHLREFTQRPVFLRRNFADLQTLEARPAPPPAGGGLRLCFASGSHGHEADFELIAGPVQRLLARDPAHRLVILGHFDASRLPAPLRPRIEPHPFTGYAAYLRQLAGCHVALMPLQDDLFNRCKSAVRVIDAASVGVASFVSPVSDMAAMVEDGGTGRVLAAPQDWDGALEAAARDRGATARMGTAARRVLEADWTARLGAPVADPGLLRWLAA
ncbi:hypothetical protein KM176_21425 [Pseudooceanicola sp. CBS1P-1]|uniref:Glycosyltransferase n=1 Tax=Pseudooceanicola albus TaxID=2692189 RepID=A0A6L7GAT8_9RHOB|nr:MULTISPECIES: glycosyltransferase family 4 protein [Pseudooceanicola]MBT9386442.1 hypothetical protein [Pseudooceanicola endophyticus]MXN20400.1 hypothetical protein [Pseudooceanicola albus]